MSRFRASLVALTVATIPVVNVLIEFGRRW
jgi:hypothetical protein